MNNLIGQNLGQYRLIETVGVGGMATVYKAYQPGLDRYVAIKVLPPQHALVRGFQERFIREARAIAQLSHPNILPIYDVGIEEDISYFVMKYVPGQTLRDLMGRPMSLERVIHFMGQICGALDHAHGRGILHRDIKPANMLLDENDWLLLADFGLAKIMEGGEALTATGQGMGTPNYVSPEQVEGETIDHRTDIYSLGIILYEMLTGQVPYHGETPMSIMFKHIYEPLPRPRTINPDIPEAVEQIILKATAKAARERYQQAGEIAQALRQYLSTDLATVGVKAQDKLQTLIVTPVQSKEMVISEDGKLVEADQSVPPPLPEFDPAFLETLDAPGGAVKMRDKFYIEREADHRFKQEVVKVGSTTTIRAPHQTGKSSLLVRGVQHARQHEAEIISLDLQRLDAGHVASADTFLRYLAELVVRKLRLDLAEVDSAWQGSLGPQDKLTYLMEDYILPESDNLIILAMDEVDRLLQTPFHTDFFALVRSWHNNRAMDELWDKLNLVMVISTEPYHLIADVNQSPFNVGLKLHLEDFNEAQIRDLNERHKSPLRDGEITQFITLLNGQPYLSRKALYTMVTERLTFAQLTQVAANEDGPFGDHLRHHLTELRYDPTSLEALKQVIRQKQCSDETARFRLMRAGLIKASGSGYIPRCDLYRIYFEDKV
jgi:serine/threonine-protein kinase